jgi:hypothetical protein
LNGIKHELNFIDYFSNPLEIMAYAYCFILLSYDESLGYKPNGQFDSEFELNADKIYKSIGGEVLDIFNHYCKEYKRIIN